MSFKKLALFTALFSASISSYAQDASVEDTGWFVGGSIGQAKSEINDGLKTTDTSVGVYGGFNFTKWFGLEAAFLATDKDKYDISLGSFSVTPKFTVVVNDSVSLFAKVGLSSVSLTDDELDLDFSGTGETFGIGAQFRLAQGVKLRISYDHISAELEDDDDYYYDIDTDITQTAVGVHYQF